MRKELERRARLLQELGFLGRRHPAERGVAVGKAPKAPDDLLMAQNVGEMVIGLGTGFRRAILDPGAEQAERARLIDQIFAVFVGKIEKESPAARQRQIESAIDGAARHLAGQGIVGESERRTTVDVARKLIEDDDQGQRVRRAFFPGGKFTRCGPFDQGCETRTDFLVEGIVFLEPEFLGPGVEPELADRPGVGKPCFDTGAQAAA
jgi:hypothetical protein